MGEMSQYLPIVFLAIFAAGFGIVSFPLNSFVAPKSPNKAKNGPYECGIEPSRELPERFPVRFYLVAMLFIMFDIEIIFLYPWAVQHDALGAFGFFAILLFSVVLFASYVYEIAKGGLEWGPRAKGVVNDAIVSSERTHRTTIKTVGTIGREVPLAPAAHDPHESEAA